jgi:hypothetical protein
LPARIPYADPSDKDHRRTWTNAKLSGETLQRRWRGSLATKGDHFTCAGREPMMPLCLNGLTMIEGC